MARKTQVEHLYPTPADDDAEASPDGIRDIATRIKKITVTDDLKLSIQLESLSLQGDALEKVKRLLSIMQGTVRVSFTPEQQELFD